VVEDVFRNLGYENVRQAERTADEGRVTRTPVRNRLAESDITLGQLTGSLFKIQTIRSLTRRKNGVSDVE
jgi:hypothetical protein